MTNSRTTGQFTAAATSHSFGQTLLVAGLVTAWTMGVVLAMSATGVAMAFAAGAVTAVFVAQRKRKDTRDREATNETAETPDRVASAPPYTLTN